MFFILNMFAWRNYFFYFLINMNNNLNEYYVDGQWGVFYNILKRLPIMLFLFY